MPTIANRLKELRKSKRLSQRAAGEAIGITERNYRKYEAGDSNPSVINILGRSDNPQR